MVCTCSVHVMFMGYSQVAQNGGPISQNRECRQQRVHCVGAMLSILGYWAIISGFVEVQVKASGFQRTSDDPSYPEGADTALLGTLGSKSMQVYIYIYICMYIYIYVFVYEHCGTDIYIHTHRCFSCFSWLLKHEASRPSYKQQMGQNPKGTTFEPLGELASNPEPPVRSESPRTGRRFSAALPESCRRGLYLNLPMYLDLKRYSKARQVGRLFGFWIMILGTFPGSRWLLVRFVVFLVRVSSVELRKDSLHWKVQFRRLKQSCLWFPYEFYKVPYSKNL